RRGQFSAGHGAGDIEYRVVWPDGSAHVIFGRAGVVRDAAGKPLRFYGTNADVTARKNAEEEVARRARQQAAVAELSLAALAAGSPESIFQQAVSLVSSTLRVDHSMVVEALPDQSGVVFRAAEGPWNADLVGKVTI